MEIKQAVVQTDLAGYLPSLRQGIVEAVAEYESSYSSALKRIHSKRSVASLIHDHIVAKMAEFAENTSGVHLTSSKKLWVLSFPEGYIVRFKKVGSNKLPSGHKTQQVKDFRNHRGLDGLPPSICLELSYQLKITRELHAVYLICPSGTWSNMWDSEILDNGARPVVVSLFGEPTDLEGATLQPKKRGVKNEAQSGDGDTGA